jgi:hypothetical protein
MQILCLNSKWFSFPSMFSKNMRTGMLHKVIDSTSVSDTFLKVCFMWWKFKDKKLHLMLSLDVCSAIILGTIDFLVEIKCINVCCNTAVFPNSWKNNYMFRPSSGWAFISLRLEYRRQLTHCNVDIKNGGARYRFAVIGEVCSYIYGMWDVRWLRQVKS